MREFERKGELVRSSKRDEMDKIGFAKFFAKTFRGCL
jgi:hypothetical protein